jgi:mannosylfructose-phosphate synthase
MEGDPAELERTYRFEARIRKEFLTYRSCDHVIATTEEQSALLRSQYDLTERNISVIPPGLDEARFTPVRSLRRQEIRTRLGLPPQFVYAVGRMAANKGYDLLIQAMATVGRLAPDARLVLAAGSDNSERDQAKEAELRATAQAAGVHDLIQWLRYIPDEDLPDYYRAASVFALSSRYEPFGMTAIEAMACGTPTVITVHGGLQALIDFGNQALFADPTFPEEFGAVLALPLRYPRLSEELAVEGSRFARRAFGWTGIARRTLAVFDQYKGKYLVEPADEPEAMEAG